VEKAQREQGRSANTAGNAKKESSGRSDKPQNQTLGGSQSRLVLCWAISDQTWTLSVLRKNIIKHHEIM
jgi:hypothetical protein